MPALPSPELHPAGKGGGQESKKLRTRCQKRYRGACKEVAVCSLTAHTDRIIQRIKAGKQKTWKLMLVVTLLGDPQEPGGRRKRFRMAFPWLCAHSRQTGGLGTAWKAAETQDKEPLGKGSSDEPWEGRCTFMFPYGFAKIRKFNSCSFQHSRIYSI